MVEFKNVERFEEWVKETVKKYLDNIEDYLDDLDRSACAQGVDERGSYEISGFFTKSGNPECYTYEVEIDFDEENEELISKVYIL